MTKEEALSYVFVRAFLENTKMQYSFGMQQQALLLTRILLYQTKARLPLIFECRAFGAHPMLYTNPGLTAGAIDCRPFGPQIRDKLAVQKLISSDQVRRTGSE